MIRNKFCKVITSDGKLLNIHALTGDRATDDFPDEKRNTYRTKQNGF